MQLSTDKNKYAMSRNKKIIGLTGGIGSGKSIVARILRCNGFEVYDCDSRAKDLMQKSPALKSGLVCLLGNEIYNSKDNSLNKALLAKLIFNSEVIRRNVNELVHEAVLDDIKKIIFSYKGFFFIESAILFSSGIDKLCDEIWVVTASEQERVNRIIKRNPTMSLNDINERINSQKEEKNFLDNQKIFILDNSENKPVLSKILLKVKPEIKNNYAEIDFIYNWETGLV